MKNGIDPFFSATYGSHCLFSVFSAQIPLGQYTEDHFTEPKALEVIDRFRMELKEIEKHILTENEGLELQYLFLLPSRIENSITI